MPSNEADLRWGFLTSEKLHIRGGCPRNRFHVKLINRNGGKDRILIWENISVQRIRACPQNKYTIVSGDVSFDPRATHILVYDKDIEILRLRIPAKPPIIKLHSKLITPQGEQEISWDCKRGKTSLLNYSVFAELDNGKKYPITGIISETKTTINFDKLPGCKKALIGIRASDGILTTEIKTDVFEIPIQPPIIRIYYPRHGQEISAKQFLELRGQGWDIQAGAAIPLDKLEWTLDGESLGSGGLPVVTSIKPGKHTITLRGRGKTGLVGKKVVKIVAS
jgi:hypothetical protein